MTDEISIVIANTRYSGWESLRVSRTMDYLCGEFSFSLVDFPFEDTRSIKPGIPVVVNHGTRPIITGYIDKVTRTKTAEQTSLVFGGRDKTSDLLDCSAIYKTNYWSLTSLYDIAASICRPFGIDVVLSGVADSIIRQFGIQTGETPFDAIERLCRANSLLPLTNSDGNLVITTVGNVDTGVRLVVGRNVLQVDYEQDNSGRFSDYLFRTQSRGEDGGDWLTNDISLSGFAYDVGVERYRPIVFVSERPLTAQEVAKRAAWEAQVRLGRAEKTRVYVPGWHHMDTRAPFQPLLWDVNNFVSFEDSGWDISARLLITSVVFELTEYGGRTTILELSPPEIYRANPGETVELSGRSSVAVSKSR